MIFVIEHLEPELFDWCKLEYKHISSVVGKDNLLFTNIDDDFLKNIGKVNRKSVLDLNLQNACILDPEAEEEFTPEVAKQFDYVIFGGILGAYPPKKRTAEELSNHLQVPKFNLGKEQMSTDTAVIVTKLICDGKKLSELKFQDGIEIDIAEGESVQLPYKYLILNGRPMLPDGLVEMLKEQEEF
ncbi:hypothetical protein COV18_03365 [Candidatus Woesearchaeota archaeon CG10_big_fil_rev_8_21_14_0_10_37_12]|nr:MAG: hypothetical protein COV18_03365 [Candidatus Woesearchaeota archaeon CG10_big_fil_rev_8_21_14_0_10_37_12]